jgi:hypothetical protein
MRGFRSRETRRVDRGTCRQGLEPRPRATPGCRRVPNTRKAPLGTPPWQGVHRPGGVGDPWHAWTHLVRTPGGPASGLALSGQGRTGNPRETTVMHGGRESDRCRVPQQPANQGCPTGPAEEVEVMTRGRSPVRECRTPGSVRGASGNWRPYHDLPSADGGAKRTLGFLRVH